MNPKNTIIYYNTYGWLEVNLSKRRITRFGLINDMEVFYVPDSNTLKNMLSMILKAFPEYIINTLKKVCQNDSLLCFIYEWNNIYIFVKNGNS